MMVGVGRSSLGVFVLHSYSRGHPIRSSAFLVEEEEEELDEANDHEPNFYKSRYHEMRREKQAHAMLFFVWPSSVPFQASIAPAVAERLSLAFLSRETRPRGAVRMTG